MTANQIKANELAKQINETAEKLSKLIESNSEKLKGYTVTVAMSVLDEEGKVKFNSIRGGKLKDIENIHTDLMTNDANYLEICHQAFEMSYNAKKQQQNEK